MNHARVPDVTRLAGVSTATVDRVLHRRPGVRALTVQRVMKAARELGYLPDEPLAAAGAADASPDAAAGQASAGGARLAAQGAAHDSPSRLVFVLPSGTNRFLQMLGDMIGYSNEQWLPFRVRCRVETIESFNPDELARQLLRHGQRADGLVFLALDHPSVREAVHALAARGVPAITLISDLSNSARAAYVGLDNRAAGRTAGYLIGRFIGARRAKVAMIAGSLSYRAHEEREMGFLHLFEEMFPAIQVVGLREGRDDEQRNFEQTRALLKQYPDLAGIYNIGGASDGVARALKEAGVEHKVVFIGHGLTPDTRALLIDGTMDAVITQNPLSAMSSCVRIFSNLREGREVLAGVEGVRSQVIFRENLP